MPSRVSHSRIASISPGVGLLLRDRGDRDPNTISVSVSARIRSSIGSWYPAWSMRWYTATGWPVASPATSWKLQRGAVKQLQRTGDALQEMHLVALGGLVSSASARRRTSVIVEKRLSIAAVIAVAPPTDSSTSSRC